MSMQSLHYQHRMVTLLQGWIDMSSTTVTIYLEFDDVEHDENTLKEAVYQYLTDLIEDDSLAYYVNEKVK